MAEDVGGQAIVIGYAWQQRIEVTAEGGAPFPSGVTLTAHVRRRRTDTTVLATLTTANGGITRVSDTEIDVVISAAVTGAMIAGSVDLDYVRTDVSPYEHCGFILTIKTVVPATQVTP